MAKSNEDGHPEFVGIASDVDVLQVGTFSLSARLMLSRKPS